MLIKPTTNQETRLQPDCYESLMKRMDPELHRWAGYYSGGDADLVNDLLQEAGIAVWQFDPSKVKPKGLYRAVRKVARYAMSHFVRDWVRDGIVDMNRGRWSLNRRGKRPAANISAPSGNKPFLKAA